MNFWTLHFYVRCLYVVYLLFNSGRSQADLYFTKSYSLFSKTILHYSMTQLHSDVNNLCETVRRLLAYLRSKDSIVNIPKANVGLAGSLCEFVEWLGHSLTWDLLRANTDCDHMCIEWFCEFALHVRSVSIFFISFGHLPYTIFFHCLT